MPTGYTNLLKENPKMSLKDFALECSRNFGVLYSMRDEPMGTKIPEKIEPYAYYTKSFFADCGKLGRFKQMTLRQKYAAFRRQRKHSREVLFKLIAEGNKAKKTYEAMLARTSEWLPTSAGHLSLRRFMIEQLTSTLRSDCDPTYYLAELKKLKSETFAKWLVQHQNRLNQSRERSREDLKKQRGYAAESTEWLKTLRTDLGTLEALQKLRANCKV